VVSAPDGTTETRTYQWRQTISFQGCQHDETSRDLKPTQMLNVDQIMVMYDANNQIIRYAMSNKIADVNGEEVAPHPGYSGRPPELPVLVLFHFLPGCKSLPHPDPETSCGTTLSWSAL